MNIFTPVYSYFRANLVFHVRLVLFIAIQIIRFSVLNQKSVLKSKPTIEMSHFNIILI
jgi:hypothetical protein